MSQNILKTCNNFLRANSLNFIWMILLLNSISIWKTDEIYFIIIRIIALIGGVIELLWCFRLLNILDRYSLTAEEMKVSKALKFLYVIYLLQLILFVIIISLGYKNFLLGLPIIVTFLIWCLILIFISVISNKRVKFIKKKGISSWKYI